MEKSINKVELSGFAGMDPEVKTMSNGTQMLRFSLATSSSYKNSKDEWVRDTTWHNIVMWGKVAELASDKIKKGCFVKLEGKIINRPYTGKNGVRQQTTEITAWSFEASEHVKKSTPEKAA
ncbi:MAG TPA: single-stranded DNA-binding protein [Bacteroidales bacterium]|nr:single-stranded DNA-binding protein [Bacteroidales bacterium]HNZ43716.1 single-stranded DNA-binding protein [Bacteroidales bacterium]HOH83236.1 single-stranded DNA-binding protein [Bacteroidales bacterium]HPB24974.1 single-stranded DNA-binding protein [Bacteroidales bacterium]HPI30984.1 single-stranded DNA-binding protein [Bacteroidales bacterium]